MSNKTKNPVKIFLAFVFYSLFYAVLVCQAVNTITKGQSVRDGETLVSVDETFELGFFSPENSSARYVGVRYHKTQEQPVVWVANRERPISDKNGVFTIAEDGNLIVKDGNENVIWSSQNASILSNVTAAVLLPTGNLVLSSNGSIGDLNKAYWQSFNDPTDTFLPNMKVFVDGGVGEKHIFSSWKSANDPSPGNFTMGVDPRGAPQVVIWEQSRRRWRSGHWNAQIFIGVPNMAIVTNYLYGFKFTSEDDGKWYFTYNPTDTTRFMRFRISWEGYEEQLKWNESENKWDLIQLEPANDCERYNYCGNFGVCTESDGLKCSCMEGFAPRYPDQWSREDWSGGCERKSPLQCQRNKTDQGEDGFKQLNSMKLPDFADAYSGISADTCQKMCLSNCSCTAFAEVNGIGCMLWHGDLIDVQNFGSKAGNSIYIRLADSELDGKRLSVPVIIVIAMVAVIFLTLSMCLLWTIRKRLQAVATGTLTSWTTRTEMPIHDVSNSNAYSTDVSESVELAIDGSKVNGPDLPLFNFNSVAAATNNFSEKNKLGQGGFGLVYKGKLPGGAEVAVKRLSKISGQGLEEFKNEVILIAKLQHRNLVRLLGCCIQGEEKLLIYEYMPNRSLDSFLFDPKKQALLNWKTRFTIIEGIARGLLYLHRDSRLRIIHRDLKASNILLDEEMNPKISDFGMARIFGGNQNEANTNRVVGTYGYMAPEYAMEGLFSVKSDVYSFGVLLLEIMSGRKNTSFRFSDQVTLIAYAWQLWEEGKAIELVDPSIRESCGQAEVVRCIQVGMLCVQDSAVHRPTMASVVLMLESDIPSVPLPRQPTFSSVRASTDTDIFLEAQEVGSSNDMTVTMISGR